MIEPNLWKTISRYDELVGLISSGIEISGSASVSISSTGRTLSVDLFLSLPLSKLCKLS